MRCAAPLPATCAAMLSAKSIQAQAATTARNRCGRPWGLPASVGPSRAIRRRLRLALGDARDVEALEAAVALVKLRAHPDEQVVEGVATETERQTLDGLELAPPPALAARQV